MATKKTTGRKTARTVRRTGRKTARVARSEILVKVFRELSQSRFKEFEAGLLRQEALADRAAKYEESRENGRREFLQSLEISLEALDRGHAKQQISQAKELKEFLDEFKPAAVSRPAEALRMQRMPPSEAQRSPRRAMSCSIRLLRPFLSTTSPLSPPTKENPEVAPSTAVGYFPKTPRNPPDGRAPGQLLVLSSYWAGTWPRIRSSLRLRSGLNGNL